MKRLLLVLVAFTSILAFAAISESAFAQTAAAVVASRTNAQVPSKRPRSEDAQPLPCFER
jgi:hypothetical protein